MPDLARMRKRALRTPAKSSSTRIGIDGLVLLGSSCGGLRRRVPRCLRRTATARPCSGGGRCRQRRFGAAPLHDLRRRRADRPAATITCTDRCSPTSTTGSISSPRRSADAFPDRCPHRHRRPVARDAAGRDGVRLGRRGRRDRAGQDHQDPGRGGLHPQRAAAQRAGDDRRAGHPSPRNPPDRPECGIPAPSLRTRRFRQAASIRSGR